MTVASGWSPLAERRAAAVRATVEAIRSSAATAQLVALTYDDVAASAAAGGDDRAGSGKLSERAVRAPRRAAEKRREARRMWPRAAALESAAR